MAYYRLDVYIRIILNRCNNSLVKISGPVMFEVDRKIQMQFRKKEKYQKKFDVTYIHTYIPIYIYITY